MKNNDHAKLLKVIGARKIDKAKRVPTNRSSIPASNIDSFTRFNKKYGAKK